MWQGPPYLDWQLDRWKIGVAVLLLLLLSVRFVDREWFEAIGTGEDVNFPQMLSADSVTPIAPVPPTAVSPAGEMIQAVASPTAVPRVQPSPAVMVARADGAAPALAVEAKAVGSPLQVMEEDAAGVVYNSQPTFAGVAEPDTQLYLLVDDRRYEIQADAQGAWRFTLPESLAAGMSWIQLVAAGDGSPLVSRMLLLASPPLSSTSAVALATTTRPASAASPTPSPSATPTTIATISVRNRTGFEIARGVAMVDESGAWSWRASTRLLPGSYQMRFMPFGQTKGAPSLSPPHGAQAYTLANVANAVMQMLQKLTATSMQIVE
jgi:hypothetical protein